MRKKLRLHNQKYFTDSKVSTACEIHWPTKIVTSAITGHENSDKVSQSQQEGQRRHTLGRTISEIYLLF